MGVWTRNVVNCFWIVSLRYWTQLSGESMARVGGCELLLNCIFEVLNTTTTGRCTEKAKLWIAFELYLWGIEHNFSLGVRCSLRVVNCFWIVSLRYWTQLSLNDGGTPISCELLLNCIFEVLNTTLSFFFRHIRQLWIAFELYLWGIEHNKQQTSQRVLCVVNCFWIVSLRYWTQLQSRF